MKIPFNEAALTPRRHKKELLYTISHVIDSGIFLHGLQNRQLSKKLQKYLKNQYVLLTSSGHSALQMALTSLFLKPDDEIIFPVNSYPTAFPLALSQGRLIPVDVDQNGLIDVEEVRKKITRKTKAIVAVHLYGLAVDILRLKEVVGKRKIALIEDCAQAFGTTYRGKPIGWYGDFACFSFYPTKNLATLGDGGALTTKKKTQYEFFKKLLSYGERSRYNSEFIAGHSRMPEIQASVLNVYLHYLSDDMKRKKAVRKEYFRALESSKLFKHLRVLFHEQNSQPNQHLFIVSAHRRDALRDYLAKQGVETSIHYPIPIHLVSSYEYLGFKKGRFPMAEHLSKSMISLPFHSYLTKKDVLYIVKKIADFYA